MDASQIASEALALYQWFVNQVDFGYKVAATSKAENVLYGIVTQNVPFRAPFK